MKTKLFVAVGIILVIGIVWWALGVVRGQTGVSSTGAASTQNQSSLSSKSSPQTDSQGNVEVIATWEGQGTSASEQKFLLQINNHMVSLDNFDYAKDVRLKVNGANVSAVVNVLNRDGEGHHVSAELGLESGQLAQLKKGDKLTLIVNDVAGTPSRMFTFTY